MRLRRMLRAGVLGGGGVAPPAAPTGPLIETGTYTGDGGTQSVSTTFEPELVLIAPSNTDTILWRDRLSWHGRSQHLGAEASEYAILSASGPKENPFEGNGFRVEGDANTGTVVYHWLAIRDNGSGFMQGTSWVGNALAARALNWTSETPDLVFVKREAWRSGQWKWTGFADTLPTTHKGGTNSTITSLSATGIVVSDDVTVNENDNNQMGEGIEGLAFIEGGAFDLVMYTGDGTESRLIPTDFQPCAAFILDAVNDNTGDTTRHAFVTDTMPTGYAKQVGGSISEVLGGLESGGVRLATAYNVSGRAYVVLAFRATTGTEAADTFARSGNTCLVTDGRLITLDNYPALSGACSLEFFGRGDFGFGSSDGVTRYCPLILLGDADPGTLATSAGTYNGGIFLAHVPLGGHGWLGYVVRVVHTDYLSVRLAESSLNYYAMNTGVIAPVNRDVHIVVTHDGSGHWRVYLNGQLVKDYNVDLNQVAYGNRTNGGTGVAKTVRLLSGNIVAGGPGAWGRCYRTQVWAGVELTTAEARALYDDVIVGGAAYAGTAATKTWDFRDNAMPDDVTIYGYAELQTMTEEEDERVLYHGYAGAAGADPQRQENGDVWVVTNAGTTNGRVGFWLPGGRSVSLRSRVSYGDASRIILRYDGVNQTGQSGTSVFDLSGTGTIERTDTIDVPAGGVLAWYVGLTAGGEKFIIHSETAWSYL